MGLRGRHVRVGYGSERGVSVRAGARVVSADRTPLPPGRLLFHQACQPSRLNVAHDVRALLTASTALIARWVTSWHCTPLLNAPHSREDLMVADDDTVAGPFVPMSRRTAIGSTLLAGAAFLAAPS